MTPPTPDLPRRDAALRDEMKSLIRDLHAGLPPEAARARFDEAIQNASPQTIGDVEEELIREGTPLSEIQRLCDLHVSVVRGGLDSQEPVEAPPGHPVHTYMAENDILAGLAQRLGELSARVGGLGPQTNNQRPGQHPGPDPDAAPQVDESSEALLEALDAILHELSAVHNHYLRKENELFPALERHGITGPPQVMWGVHDDIRRQLKGARVSLLTLRTSGANLGITEQTARSSVRKGAREALAHRSAKLARAISEMTYKENKILFPMALRAIGHDQWAAIRRGEDELGYAFGGPEVPFPPRSPAESRPGLSLPVLPAGPSPPAPQPAVGPAAQHTTRPGEASLSAGKAESRDSSPAQAILELGTGGLTLEQVDMILRHLPVDLSFVDAEGYVRYYSETPDRLFPRTPGAIGRHVEKCHPPKSLTMVREILRAFAAGDRDVAEFWLQLKGRFIHIRYFAVRDPQGQYMGCLEVSQDVTPIRGLQGQRRLLEWS